MKLQHLAIGDRFEYEGQIYVKTGPLTASGEIDGQRIIPRYAVLRSITSSTAETDDKNSEPVPDKNKIMDAFDQFYRSCKPMIDAQHHPELESARLRFLSLVKGS